MIPEDRKHLHFGDGATKTDIKLPPGKHTLCLQVGDGAHRAFGNTDTVKITVKKWSVSCPGTDPRGCRTASATNRR